MKIIMIQTVNANETVTWSLTGDDASLFEINSSGELVKSAPDYENPLGGANDDSNAYSVTVIAIMIIQLIPQISVIFSVLDVVEHCAERCCFINCK